MSEGPISLFFLWFFLTFLPFKINLSIHITFTLSKYDQKRKPYVLSKHFRQAPIIFSVLWQCTFRRGRWLLLFRYSCVMISVEIFALNPRIPKGMLNDT